MDPRSGLDVPEDVEDLAAAEGKGIELLESEPGGGERFAVRGGFGGHVGSGVAHKDHADAGAAQTGLVFDAHNSVKGDGVPVSSSVSRTAAS